MIRLRPHKLLLQTPTSSSDGCEDDGIDLKMIVLIMNSTYCIVHQNLDSRISINIGGSHFGHLFVTLACLLFRHVLEHLNSLHVRNQYIFGSFFKILYTCGTPFCKSTYFVSFFDGMPSTCDPLPISNVPVLSI